ncbi:hypothetical protein K4K54_010297 [Colletotrichum sp. SAR 10_86]|nr:hypothetical protein K4K51_012464 [Colletotrichum sp. SAR 10_75]KAI8213351.1 hypothetical protein K4K52_005276 [Colletotrichum sp. SAR 10_76]KAI8233522.1 hypothetical protein K4K54_010297 [Colletotrichum sp. SAR 10_86]KAJ5005191.1 hypothetical protein K4K48_007843 [Colletotrichum sp. SAR 10_66]
MPRIRGYYSCGINGHRAAECDIADKSRNAGVAYFLRGWRIGSLADYDIVQDGIINEGRKNSIPDLPTVWAHILRSKAYPQLEAAAKQFYNRYYLEQVPGLESSIRHQEAAVAADKARREREEARRQASITAIDCIDIGYARGHTVDINHIEDEEPVEVNAITRMKNNNFRHTPYGNSSARKIRFADRISTQQATTPTRAAPIEEVVEDEIIVQVPPQPQPQEPARREETKKLHQATLFSDSKETRSQAAALHSKKRTGNVTLPEQFLLDN